MMNTTTLLCVIALAIIVVLLFRGYSKKRFIAGRRAMDDVELASLYAGRLPAPMLLDVVKMVGESYGIPFAKLRPEDCLINGLSKIDSWNLDGGAEKLANGLRVKYGLSLPSGRQQLTISDLVDLIAIHRSPTNEERKNGLTDIVAN